MTYEYNNESSPSSWVIHITVMAAVLLASTHSYVFWGSNLEFEMDMLYLIAGGGITFFGTAMTYILAEIVDAKIKGGW